MPRQAGLCSVKDRLGELSAQRDGSPSAVLLAWKFRCQGGVAAMVVRAKVEHVFVQQKDRMKLTIRSIRVKRAEAMIIKANIADNLVRWRWSGTRAAPA